MADRTSAEIFGAIFEELDKLNEGDAKRLSGHAVIAVLAMRIMAISEQYDFCVEQMECDPEVLERLTVERSF